MTPNLNALEMPPKNNSTAASRMPDAQRRRSRAGCTRCRRHRKRCDQLKPACLRCQQASNPCNYELNIKWGGRAFPKLLGSYAESIQRLNNAAGGDGFVYTVQSQHSDASDTAELRRTTSEPSFNRRIPSSPVQRAQLFDTIESTFTPSLQWTRRDYRDNFGVVNSEGVATTSSTISVVASRVLDRPRRFQDFQLERLPHTPSSWQIDTPEVSPNLPPMHRFLLHHYIHETISLTAPSDYVRTEICRSIVVMSLRHPCLLFAVLAFAARHLHSLGGLQAGQGEGFVAELEDNSISHLRRELTDPNFDQYAVALATTRTLCQSQIFAAGNSWRTHLEGARAILQAAVSMSCHANKSRLMSEAVPSPPNRRTPIHMFLASWYNNTEAQVALTPLGLRRGQLEMVGSSRFDAERSGFPSHLYFDVFGGVASDVPDLFREVGALVIERRRLMKSQQHRCAGEGDSILGCDDIACEAEALVHEIHARLERDAVGKLCLDNSQLVSLSCDDIYDYTMSNTAFLHTALLYVRCAVQCLPLSAPEVRHSVQQIVLCSDNMKSASTLSPRVLMATPLFTAGLWSLPDAQAAVRRIFKTMSTWIRTPHIMRSAALLEYVWSKTSIPQQHHDVLTYLEESPDFLPY